MATSETTKNNEEEIRIRMLKSISGNIFISKLGTDLLAGREYEAKVNQFGDVSGLCDNGAYLGVKPGEFEFIEAPDWLKKSTKIIEKERISG